MENFVYEYPTKVYFGKGAAKQHLVGILAAYTARSAEVKQEQRCMKIPFWSSSRSTVQSASGRF